MPEVKAFVNSDLPLYHNVPFKHIGGANPDLLLLDKDGFVIKRIDLKNKKRQEINELLQGLGFYKKSSRDEQVPEEYSEGPYLPKEIKEEEPAKDQPSDSVQEKEEL